MKISLALKKKKKKKKKNSLVTPCDIGNDNIWFVMVLE